MKTPVLSLLIVVLLSACNYHSEKEHGKENAAAENQHTKIEYAGNYTTPDYTNRNRGYDWIAVLITVVNDSTLRISVRSRADIKKPSCRFDAEAKKISDSIFTTIAEGKTIVYRFYANSLNIGTGKKEDEEILNFYCSGGGSMRNTYQKIKEPLDEKQIDKTVFNKILHLQNMGYEISSLIKNGAQQLIVTPYGLTGDNQPISLPLSGPIKNAEIEDMDADGFPEVIIYEAVSEKYGGYTPIGFSPNKGKSVSRIYFPATADNPKINKGYYGNDDFAIVENTLVQRFKLYEIAGGEKKETGKMRQIQYKLKNGEASKQFVIDKVLEF